MLCTSGPPFDFLLVDPTAGADLEWEWFAIDSFCNVSVVAIFNTNIPRHAGGWIRSELLLRGWHELATGAVESDSFFPTFGDRGALYKRHGWSILAKH